MSAILHRALRVFVGCVALSVCAQSVVSARAADEPVSNAPLSNEAVLLRALDRSVSVNFKNDPIRDAIDMLIDRLPPEDKISMAIDQRALSKAEVDLDARITLKATNICLSSALDFMLGQVGAAWTIKDEMLVITTREVADGHMLVLSHGMTGLAYRDEGAERAAECRRLLDVIKKEIAPKSWDTRGGEGVIELQTQSGDTLTRCNLIVRQTAAVHCEMAGLVADVRDHAPQSAVEKKIREALAGPTIMDFVEVPLAKVVDDLEDLHHITIVLDLLALEQDSVSAAQPVTKVLRGVSLMSALRLVLEPLDLTFVIRDEILLITTNEHAKMLAAEAGSARRHISPTTATQTPTRNPQPAAQMPGAQKLPEQVAPERKPQTIKPSSEPIDDPFAERAPPKQPNQRKPPAPPEDDPFAN